MSWFWWGGVTLCLFPIWGALLWELWEGSIRPRFITDAEVDALSTSMLARYGDRAEKIAFMEEDRAWRYSESFEQGKWRRVRRELRRRRQTPEISQPARCNDESGKPLRP